MSVYRTVESVQQREHLDQGDREGSKLDVLHRVLRENRGRQRFLVSMPGGGRGVLATPTGKVSAHAVQN